MGAAGRDYYNFLICYKDNPEYEVVAFTQAQIPGIEKRSFPKSLAGKQYTKNIPFYPEEQLATLIKKYKVDEVILAYSDLSHQDVMHKASLVLAAGADFKLLGPTTTQVTSKKPVIAITAVRTGSGKSQTSRAVAEILRSQGKKVVAIRHGMPYGNLEEETCQRFAAEQDFKKYKTTIEEEEEYQPWITNGFVVYSGFDYKEIVKAAEQEADALIFDGGNNDLSMLKPDLLIVVVDPHRPGHELTYYPGFVNFLMADIIIINKVDSAKKENISIVEENIQKYNPKAAVIHARSELVVDHPERIKKKRCAVIGDGPTLSHGGMSFGAGTLAVKQYGGIIVNPKPYVLGSIKETFQKYKHLHFEIPAMGYSKRQIHELQESIKKIPCDLVVDGTPANLQRIMKISKPIVNVGYELDQKSVKQLEKIIRKRGVL